MLKSCGRAFHSQGATDSNYLPPLVLSLVQGTTARPRSAGLSDLLGACQTDVEVPDHSIRNNQNPVLDPEANRTRGKETKTDDI